MKILAIILAVLFSGLPATVICPDCQKEGRKSSCVQISSTTTLVSYAAASYDENGKPVYRENPSKTTWQFKCSNGHLFDVKEK